MYYTLNQIAQKHVVWFADCRLRLGWHNYHDKVWQGICHKREWLEVCI